MPAEPPFAVHATAVAISGRALLVLGASRAGKSTLAARLIARSGRRHRILLLGDDRILLFRRDAGLEARPHPRIAGFLERRGLGLVAVPWAARAEVAAVATLDDAVAPAWIGNLPRLRLVDMEESERCEAVLAWWPRVARERHRPRTFSAMAPRDREDWNW